MVAAISRTLILRFLLALVAIQGGPLMAQAVLLSLEPASGPLAGGYPVKVRSGDGTFLSGFTRVVFGGRPLEVQVTDPFTLVVEAPPGRFPAGRVEVAVEAAGEVHLVPGGFLYLNTPPRARAARPQGYRIRLGDSLVLDGSRSTDPDGPAGDAVAAHEWDLDGDGLPDRHGVKVVLSPQEVRAFAGDGSALWQVRLRVLDLHGAEGRDTAEVVVKPATPQVSLEDYREWGGDADRNKLDDALDRRSPGERVDVIVVLERGADLESAAARLAPLSTAPPARAPAISALCLKGVRAADVREAVAVEPQLFRVEEELVLAADLDVAPAAARARSSGLYSPRTAGDRGFSGAGVNIAILDSGVDDGHPALAGKLVGGFDAFQDPPGALGSASNPDDDFAFAGIYHGTHVAGIALGADPARPGVAPGARLLDVKVLDDLGQGTTATLLLGLQWCIDNRSHAWPGQPAEHHGIDVVNLSLASRGRSDGKDAVSMMVDAAAAAGLVVVASAGNSGSLGPGFGSPGAADRAITVAALDDRETVDRSDDAPYPQANFGPRLDDGDSDLVEELKPDLAAPGVTVLSPNGTSPGQASSGSTPLTGSSAASAVVAGAAALILEAHPGLEAQEVKAFLRGSAEPLGEPLDPELDPTYSIRTGRGILDAYRALPVPLGVEDLVWTALPGDDRAAAVHPDPAAAPASSLQPGSPYALGGGREPSGIAVDGQGSVWLANRRTASLTKLNSGGSLLFHLPLGPLFGALDEVDVGGIAIDREGDAWLTLSSSGRVVQVRADGTADPAARQVGQAPVALALDAAGNVWVANSGSNDVTRLGPDGVEAAGSPFPAGSSPSAIACDRAGRVYVANQGSSDLTVLEPDGSPRATLPVGTAPVALAIDGSGRVWAISSVGGSVSRLDPSGGPALTFAVGAGPAGICIGGDGTVWVALFDDGVGSSLVRLAGDGAVLESVQVGAAPLNLGDATGFAHASAVDPAGDADGDGFSNAEEIDAATNPFDRSRHVVVLAAIDPAEGSVNGGNQVRLLGRGLEAPLVVEVGGQPAAVLEASGIEAAVLVPPGPFPPPGPLAVEARRPDGSSALFLGAYLYRNDPPIADPDPDPVDDGYRVVVGDTLVLDGRSSSDPNAALGDGLVRHLWTLNGRPLGGRTVILPAAALASLGMGAPGSYDLVLRVEDTLGAEGSAATRVVVLDPSSPAYLRGDATADARVDIADAIFLLSWLFTGGAAPHCRDAANANGDNRLDLADAIWLLSHLFTGGAAPPPPHPVCAPGPIVLGCAASPCS